MKNLNNTFFKTLKTFVVILTLACTASLSAQPGFDDDVDDDGVAAPIDGGISLLIAAGAIYGIKRLRDNKNDSI